eukprot:s1252_g20.t1
MEEAVGDAVITYNSGINEHGVAPIQLVTYSSWEAAIDEVVQAAITEASRCEQPSVTPGSVPAEVGLGLDGSAGLGRALDFLEERLSQHCSQLLAVDFNLMHPCQLIQNCLQHLHLMELSLELPSRLDLASLPKF